LILRHNFLRFKISYIQVRLTFDGILESTSKGRFES